MFETRRNAETGSNRTIDIFSQQDGGSFGRSFTPTSSIPRISSCGTNDVSAPDKVIIEQIPSVRECRFTILLSEVKREHVVVKIYGRNSRHALLLPAH